VTELSPEDEALLDEAARRVAGSRLAVPAMMFLETLTPMNFVTATMLQALTPVLGIALPVTLLARVARLLERRETIPEFVRRIDAAEESRRRAAAAARAR
jgi:hypothetical protein